MRILCAGLYPALQRTLMLDAFRTGAVNRVREVLLSIGGKAVNSARVLKTLGAEPLLFGLAGGDTGHTAGHLLDAEMIPHRFIRTDEPVRLCQTLMVDGAEDFTELVEEGPELPPAQWLLLQARFAELLEDDPPQAIIISGTLPAHAPPGTYARMLETAACKAAPVLLDTSGTPLRTALAYHPALVKINAEELFRTVGNRKQGTGETQAIEQAARVLIAEGAIAVGITQGNQDAWLVTATRTTRFAIPRVDVISTLGCGDAVNAGCVFALQRGDTLQDAFAFGLACGVSNAMHRLPGRIDPSHIGKLLAGIRHATTGACSQCMNL